MEKFIKTKKIIIEKGSKCIKLSSEYVLVESSYSDDSISYKFPIKGNALISIISFLSKEIIKEDCGCDWKILDYTDDYTIIVRPKGVAIIDFNHSLNIQYEYEY